MELPTQYDVFVSYSRVDKPVAAVISSLLRVTSASVFRDEESIPPGKQWKLAITESLKSSHTVIVFWSSAAADSKAVEKEYRTAMKLKKNIVPILLDDTPLVSNLAKYQWIDFRELVRNGKSQSVSENIGGILASQNIARYIPGVQPFSLHSAIAAVLVKMSIDGVGVKFNSAQEAQIKISLANRITGLCLQP